MDYSVKELNCISDERGELVEVLKKDSIPGEDNEFGQIYMATIEPGHVRGNHYHEEKTEFYALIHGNVLLALEDVETGEHKEVEVEAEEGTAARIRVGPMVAHAIKNISDTAVVLCAYTDIEYDSENPDQKAHELLEPSK